MRQQNFEQEVQNYRESVDRLVREHDRRHIVPYNMSASGFELLERLEKNLELDRFMHFQLENQVITQIGRVFDVDAECAERFRREHP